jgi:ATP synthase protein I
VSIKVSQSLECRAYWLVVLQGIVVVTAAIIAWLIIDKRAAYAILLGGVVSILPNLYFAWRLFHRIYGYSAQRLLMTFYRNEIIKLVLMGLLFIVIIKLKIVANLPFIIGFILAQLGTILLPLLYGIDGKTSDNSRVK